MRNFGFTLIEFLGTLLIAGILFATVMPRFFSMQTFVSRSFYDQTLAMVRYGQKVAVAQRTQVQVKAEANAICLKYLPSILPYQGASSCADSENAVLNPADGKPFVQALPGKMNAKLLPESTTPFFFNGLGKPSSAATLTIEGDDMRRAIQVEAETGYVH